MSSDEDDFLYDAEDDSEDCAEKPSDEDVAEEDDDGIGMDMEPFQDHLLDDAPGGSGVGAEKVEEEEFFYEVLTTEQIVGHMVECIKDVNTVIEVSQSGIVAER